mmetsp:Transcript_1080/g.2972  ORF Transcript_1080/g.2972 Transcript_1080/m.2972 type:complete len:231 (+) Transcript_1080:160-852(+)
MFELSNRYTLDNLHPFFGRVSWFGVVLVDWVGIQYQIDREHGCCIFIHDGGKTQSIPMTSRQATFFLQFVSGRCLNSAVVRIGIIRMVAGGGHCMLVFHHSSCETIAKFVHRRHVLPHQRGRLTVPIPHKNEYGLIRNGAAPVALRYNFKIGGIATGKLNPATHELAPIVVNDLFSEKAMAVVVVTTTNNKFRRTRRTGLSLSPPQPAISPHTPNWQSPLLWQAKPLVCL